MSKDKVNKPAAPVKERKFRGVTLPTASHKAIRKVKRAGHEPAIHGTKLWRSSFLIIDYLHKNPPELCSKVLQSLRVQSVRLGSVSTQVDVSGTRCCRIQTIAGIISA